MPLYLILIFSFLILIGLSIVALLPRLLYQQKLHFQILSLFLSLMPKLRVIKKAKSTTPSFYLLCWPQKAKSGIRWKLLKNKRISPNFRSVPTFQTSFLITSIMLLVNAFFPLSSTMIWYTQSIKPLDLEKIFQYHATMVLAARALSQSFCGKSLLLRYLLQSTQKLIGSG